MSIELASLVFVTVVICCRPPCGNPVMVAPVASIVPFTSSVAPEAISISADAGS